MKYSFEVKKEIYEKLLKGYGSDTLSREYGLSASYIRYLRRLVAKHGLDVITHKYSVLLAPGDFDHHGAIKKDQSQIK